MVNQSRPPTSPESSTVRMCGCWSRAARRISRWNRSVPSEAASSGWRTLSATGRSCLRSRARKTVAMPPRPSSRSNSYRSRSPSRSPEMGSAMKLCCPRLRRPLDQPLEPRALPQRVEVGIDPEPPGREIVGNLEQRLQLLDGFVVFPGQGVDPCQQMLIVCAAVGILRDRLQGDAALTLLDGLRLVARERQHQPVERVRLRIVGRVSELRLIPDTPGVTIGPRPGLITPVLVSLREHAAPDAPVVVELRGRESDQQPLLLVV